MEEKEITCDSIMQEQVKVDKAKIIEAYEKGDVGTKAALTTIMGKEFFCPGQLYGRKSTFRSICENMAALQEKKNHDYGNAFALTMDEFGLTSAAIRLTDKLNRFKRLIKAEAKVKDESIEDTLIDMSAYCIMAIEWMDKNRL